MISPLMVAYHYHKSYAIQQGHARTPRACRVCQKEVFSVAIVRSCNSYYRTVWPIMVFTNLYLMTIQIFNWKGWEVNEVNPLYKSLEARYNCHTFEDKKNESHSIVLRFTSYGTQRETGCFKGTNVTQNEIRFTNVIPFSRTNKNIYKHL